MCVGQKDGQAIKKIIRHGKVALPSTHSQPERWGNDVVYTYAVADQTCLDRSCLFVGIGIDVWMKLKALIDPCERRYLTKN